MLTCESGYNQARGGQQDAEEATELQCQIKFRVALEAAKGQKTVNEIASEHGVHPNRVSEWKQALLRDGANLFARADGHRERALEAQEAELYEQIGRL